MGLVSRVKYERLKRCENSFLDLFADYFASFITRWMSELKIEHENITVLAVILESDIYDKKFCFSVTDGTNIDGLDYNGFRFFIEKVTDGGKRNWFSIEDYCKYQGIVYENPAYYVQVKDLPQTVEEYLRKVLSVLRDREFEKVLFSDVWKDIPADYSSVK